MTARTGRRADAAGRLRPAARRPRRPLDDAAWEEVEEALIAADVGADARGAGRRACPRTARRRRTPRPRSRPSCWPSSRHATRPRGRACPAPGVPAVVLVVGVNGTGKTTTVAKLGNRFAHARREGPAGRGDTFRAAADRAARDVGEARRPAASSPTRRRRPIGRGLRRAGRGCGARRRRRRRRHRGPPAHQDAT